MEHDNMTTPTIHQIAEELNRRAHEHPIGTLQEIRGRRTGNDLFRINSNTTRDGWACHWGGRTELQFNIGIESSSNLRHGVAFDFGPSRSYPSTDLIPKLKSKVQLFNKFVRRHPEVCADMYLWAWDDKRGELIYDEGPGPIPAQLLVANVFVFLGKLQPINRIDYEVVLNDFDRLFQLYKYVESAGRSIPTSVPLETRFSFRPGCRTRKRSAIVRESHEQIRRELRHNELQKVLYRRLAKRFGRQNVGTENQGVHGTSIDLVVRRNRSFWFYEIKTAQSPRECIREALGQLLEYAFWPGAQEAARLIVASECALDKEGKEYLRFLNQQFSLPLVYEQIRV
jgi:hypothetical protein